MVIMGLWCLCADPYTLLTLTPLPPFPPSQSYQAILLQTFVMLYLLHNTKGVLASLPSNCLWVNIYGFQDQICWYITGRVIHDVTN